MARRLVMRKGNVVTRLISLVVLIGIVGLCAWLVLEVLGSFLLPMFLAVVMVVVFRPLHNWLTDRLNGRVRTAAGITTTIILLIVLLPFITVLAMAATEGISMVRNLNQSKLEGDLDALRKRFSLEMPGKDAIEEIEALLREADDASLTLERRSKLHLDIATQVERLKPAVNEVEQTLSGYPQRREDLASSYSILVDLVQPWATPVKNGSETNTAHEYSARERQEMVSNSFFEFRSALYGGPWLYRLKRLANPGPEDLRQVRQRIDNWLGPMALSTTQYVGGVLGGLLIGLGVMVISLYFFLADGPGMVRTVMRLSPLEDRYEQEMLDEFDRISRAVVLATLVSAAAQAVLAGLGYLIVGLDAVILLTFLTGLFAMVPFVGATAVWLPCSLWLFLVEGRPTAAIGLAIYGTLVVSMVDNVIKPYILHGHSNMHPLMALLSVLGGVEALGPIGIFVGPMIVAFLQALLNILRKELIELDQEAAKSGESIIEHALHHPHTEPEKS